MVEFFFFVNGPQGVTRRVRRNFLKVLVDPDSPNVDIIAVHGLNPWSSDSHAEATWTAGGKLWLKDFLPERLPNARILLFGYNANLAFGASIAGVREQAINLLNRIASKREDVKDRPIIFVAHDLGGIIVKRALVEAKLDDTYTSIRNATYGIAFFGTPHKGSNFAKLGNLAVSIIKSLLRQPSNSFMQALIKDSLFSNNLADDFRHCLEDYYVLSFFETLPTKMVGIIVDKKSATLGLPGLREKQIAMHADHAGVCRFDSADDDNYKQVSFHIVQLVKNAAQDAAERALGILKAFSFVSANEAGDLFDMHRLIHLATRDWLRRKGTFDRWAVSCLVLISQKFPNDGYERMAMEMPSSYFPHCKAVLPYRQLLPALDVSGADIACHMAKHLHSHGSWKAAEVLAAQAYEDYSEALGSSHVSTFVSICVLSMIVSVRGRSREALNSLRQFLKHKRTISIIAEEKMLTREDLNVLFTTSALARELVDHGEHNESQEIYRQILQARQRTQGLEHRDTLGSMQDLAGAFFKQGRYEEAKQLYEQTLKADRNGG
ncbi:hypothetical protein MMC18_009345 [Xylographa bjoerkii]|nr:hypothetical protein [Xylographa bjoerkii]